MILIDLFAHKYTVNFDEKYEKLTEIVDDLME
jgi:esterase/lipase superfamily enzyme